MRRRIHFVTIVLALILGFWWAGEAFGGVADQLREADRLAGRGDSEQAEEIYREVAAGEAGTDYGLEAQEKLTCLYVKAGRRDEGQAGLAALRSGYRENSGLVRAVTHVGDAYRETGVHVKACEVYSNVISEWPGDEHAMWSQMGLTMSRISQGNDTAAEGALEQLRTGYGGQAHLSRAVCIVGDHYRELGKHSEALELYGDVLEKWPRAEFAMWACMGEAISKIRLGEGAEGTIVKLAGDFEGQAGLPAALCSVGDEYRKLGVHNAACELYGEIIERHPESEEAFWAQQNIALSRIWLKDELGAADAVGEVLEYSGGEDERIAGAARTIGDEYRKAEKYDEAFELYEYVVEEYGDTKEGLWSQMNLAIAEIRLGDPNADSAAEKLLADYSEESEIAAAICWVGDQYRRSGRRRKGCGRGGSRGDC